MTAKTCLSLITRLPQGAHSGEFSFGSQHSKPQNHQDGAPCLPRQRLFEPPERRKKASIFGGPWEFLLNPTPASATTCDFRVPPVTMAAAACHVELGTRKPDLGVVPYVVGFFPSFGWKTRACFFVLFSFLLLGYYGYHVTYCSSTTSCSTSASSSSSSSFSSSSSSGANDLFFPNLYIYPIHPIHFLIYPKIIRSTMKKRVYHWDHLHLPGV